MARSPLPHVLKIMAIHRIARVFSSYLLQVLPRQHEFEGLTIHHNTIASLKWILGVRGLSTDLIQHSLNSTKARLHEYDEHDKRTLYIRDFSQNTSTSTLKQAFSVYGTIEDVSIIRTDSGKSKGFGYVTFKEEESATRALNSTRHFIDNKWITVQKKIQNTSFAGQSRKIRVTNVPQKITQQKLEEHFSKFGKVSEVEFVTVDPVSKKRKGYCFVEFGSEKDASKAVETLTHVIDGVEVKVHFSTSRFKALSDTKEVLVRLLPRNTTVEQLREHFSKYGDLVRVDLICKRYPKNSDTFAFLKFECSQSAKRVSEAETQIFGEEKVLLKRTSLKYPMKNRHLKLFVEDLPPQINLKQIQNYFSQFGTVNYIQNRELLWQGNVTVVFASQHGVNSALSITDHIIDGQKFNIRRLCWNKNISLFDLASEFHFKDFRKGKAKA